MAGGQYPQQPQYDPYQQGYDPNAVALEEEQDLSEFSDEQSQVTRQLPWMAVAMVIHGFLLLVAAYIAKDMAQAPFVPPLDSALEQQETPPPPEDPEPPPLENREDQEVVEEVKQEQIVPEATDERNEDPTDSPLQEMDSPDSADSPNPNVGPNSSLGFGGGAGGGGGSGGGGGLRYLRSGGGGRGGKPNHDRTDAALQWLADHQNPNGHWSASQYHNDSIRTAKGAKITRNIDFRDDIGRMRGTPDNDVGMDAYNVGLTGLAVLAFVGDGHTHKDGKFAQNVNRGIRYLMSAQDNEGCFGARDDDEYVYNHAICAMAIAELYEMTLAPNFKGRAQKAVDFIVRCQNPGSGWRYGVQPKENDSSVTAWMVLALKSAMLAGLEFPAEEVYRGANIWYDKVTGKDESGYDRTGYDRPGGGNARTAAAINYDMNASMDACSVMVRLFTDHTPPGDRKLNSQAQLMIKDLPTWYMGEEEKNGPWKIDMYYWYYASLALFQLGGSLWNSWEARLINPVLLKYQRGWHPKDQAAIPGVTAPSYLPNGEQNPEAGRWKLDEHGSWDPVDPWGLEGGRVYSTAINALTLEVYYRYRKVSETSKK